MNIFNIFLICCVILTINCEQLPADIPRCRAADSNCIIRVSNIVIKQIANGRSDLSLPPIDPFFIKNVDIDFPGGSAIDLKIKFNDVTAIGLSSLVFDRASGFTKDPYKTIFEMAGTLPKFEFHGNYKANGRVLVLPFQGDGKFKVSLKNSKLSFKIKPRVFKKADGLTYLKLDKIKIHMEPENAQVYFGNLFNGNEELGKTVNNLINENWRELWQEFSPAAYNIAEKIIKETVAVMFERFNYDDIHLD